MNSFKCLGATCVARVLVLTLLLVPGFASGMDWIDLSQNAGKVGFELPAGWRSVKDLFGMPLTLIGPRREDASPVIVFSSSGLHGLKFDEKSLKEREGEYREGREKWLATRAGRSIRYFDYRKEIWNGGLEVHHVGYEYALLYTAFIENSYYILCNDQLYHLKTLVRSVWGEETETQVERIAKSFRCSKEGRR